MQQKQLRTNFSTSRARLHVGCGGSQDIRIKERTTGRLDLQLAQLCIPLLNISHTSTMESDQNTLRSYALTLLTLIGNQQNVEENPLFGEAMRLDTGHTIYRQTSHRVLQALIEYSPSPETIVKQFLEGLMKCKISDVETLAASLLNGDRSVGPNEWAAGVCNRLNENKGDRDISAVESLANYYLNSLILPFRNPSGKTPQDTHPPTPDPDRTREIRLLLEKATTARNQGALKELVLRRDGYSCPVTGADFEGYGSIVPQCAHIIPFAIHDKHTVHAAIEMFTGNEVKAEFVMQFINNPANAINLQADAHHSMDKSLAWGIEARLDSNEWKYYFRAVKQARIPKFVHNFIKDGDEMQLGKGVNGAEIDLPDPRICNLHL
ncbi:hypothetical protein BGY98DRAFT_167201, partial [Russula aff. rugulosa BPL654]